MPDGLSDRPDERNVGTSISERGTEMGEPTPLARDMWLARRRQETPEKINGATIAWMASLPADIRPQILSVRHTRIANELGRLWDNPGACLSYLEQLLVDRRGNRQGFALEVAMELAGLKNHYETVVRPMPQTAWDQIVSHQF